MRERLHLLTERLSHVLEQSFTEAALIAVMNEAVAEGASRSTLYDALHLALEARRCRDEPLQPEDEATVEDVLDRVWGYCSRGRLLFPRLPPIEQ